MGKQNEKLLSNMKELDKQKLPKWFTGECYTKQLRLYRVRRERRY